MRKSLLALTICLLTILPSSRAVDFIFTDIWDLDDDDYSSDWSYPSAWESGLIPSTDGTANVFFGSTLTDSEEDDFGDYVFSIGLESDVNVNSITFDADSNYSFYASLYGASVTIQDFVLMIEGDYESEAYFGYGLEIYLADHVEFNLGFDTEIEFAGTVHMDSTQTTFIDGGGGLLLAGDNAETLMGRIQVLSGQLGLAHDNAAGTATIELGDAEDSSESDLSLVAVDGDRRIENPIIVNGLLRTDEDDDEENELALAGPVTFNGDSRIENYGGILTLEGALGENAFGTKITVSADEPVIIGGPTNFTGGLDIEEGVVLFADISALPSASTSPDAGATSEGSDPFASISAIVVENPTGFFTASSADSYLGLMIESATDRLAATSTFLSLIDPTNFNGTIGFDTDPDATQSNNYSGPIDLTGMAASRIGTVTRAELSGTITPSGKDYQFGNGGGTLLVGSILENDNLLEVSRGVQVQSTSNDPITVYLNNASNSFSGQASAQHSALIFGNAPGTLPSGVTLQPLEGGYIGIQDTTRTIADYIGQFDTTISTGFIGFDSQDRDTNRVINDNIDLSAFSSTTPDFFLGTSTWVNLGGTITLPTNATKYRFAGYKGGFLNVTSTLTDASGGAARGVQIGDESVRGTFGAEFPGGDSVESGVRLEGTNTYSGGTYLSAGELVITNNASLGSGPLVVAGEEIGFTDVISGSSDFDGGFDDRIPVLMPDASNLIVPNAIEVDGFFEINVPIGLVDQNLSLAGNIVGPGGIDKFGQGTLNLEGDNSGFTGGLYISEGTVNINSNSGAGAGPIGFGDSSGSGGSQELSFHTSSPTIGGLYRIEYDDEDYYSSTSTPIVNLSTGSILTINVENLDLEFDGSITGDGGLKITGNGTQELSGYSSFTGGVTIGAGATLRAGESGSLGGDSITPPSVTLDGGNLRVDGEEDSSFRAAIAFGPNGGEISGNGTLSFDGTLTIGDKTSISPGNSIGRVHFDGALEFGELGSLTVEIGEDGMGDLIADRMTAQSLNITATNANPFSINLGGEDSQVPSAFDAAKAASWTIVGSLSSFTNFDISNFDFNVSSELQSAGGLGLWNLALGSSGTSLGETTLANNTLVVSFTPVPEPSTFLLFGLGVALLGCRRGRGRRSA